MLNKMKLIIPFAAVLVSELAFADEIPPSRWVIDVPKGNYLETFEHVSAIDDKWAGYRRTAKSWVYAVLGDERLALSSIWDMEDLSYSEVIAELSRHPSEICKEMGYEDICWSDGFSAVRELAHGNRLVFVNEGHHMSRHRTFLEALLPDLWKMGYRYLAVEALDEKTIEALQKNEPMPLTQSFYLHDPQFANMLRTAHALGFVLVAYEQTGEQMKGCANCSPREVSLKREKDQSENLYNKTFLQDTDAFVVAYGGFGHIYKCRRQREDGTFIETTATLLNKKLDGQMVSINQTENYISGISNIEFTDKKNVTVFAFPGDDCVDLKLSHDISEEVAETQRWRGWIKSREKVTLSMKNDNLKYPILLEVYNSSFSPEQKTVPVDRVTLWEPGTGHLWAPKEGEAHFYALTSDGQRLTLEPSLNPIQE